VRPSNAILMIILVATAVSCAGGAKQVVPTHLSAGMGQIKKGNEWYQRGCYNRSLEHYMQANERFSLSDQQAGIAVSLNNIGNVYRILEDYDSAALFFDEAYRTYSALGDAEGMVRLLTNRASVYLAQGELAKAEATLNKAEVSKRQAGMLYPPLERNRAILLTRQGRYGQAEAVLNELLPTIDPGNRTEIAATHVAFANILTGTNRPLAAIDHLKAALSADQWAGYHQGIADDLTALGSIYQTTGNHQLAADHYQRSLKIYALIGRNRKAMEILDRLEEIDRSKGLDLSLTKLFMDRWLEGKADHPCD